MLEQTVGNVRDVKKSRRKRPWRRNKKVVQEINKRVTEATIIWKKLTI